MRVRTYVGGAVAGAALMAGSALWAQAPGRVIEITADDTMHYSMTTIEAKAGESLDVKLTNKGAMPKAAAAHNFVVLKKGTDVDAFTTAAVMARDTGYIPDKFKASVIVSTALTGPGETVEARFKAPTVAGTYQYLCSFPGHYAAGMKGSLVVK
jgi:azurin